MMNSQKPASRVLLPSEVNFLSDVALAASVSLAFVLGGPLWPLGAAFVGISVKNLLLSSAQPKAKGVA